MVWFCLYRMIYIQNISRVCTFFDKNEPSMTLQYAYSIVAALVQLQQISIMKVLDWDYWHFNKKNEKIRSQTGNIVEAIQDWYMLRNLFYFNSIDRLDLDQSENCGLTDRDKSSNWQTTSAIFVFPDHSSLFIFPEKFSVHCSESSALNPRRF